MLCVGDALILLGDGVYASLQGTPACARLLDTGVELYVLHGDACAAGILQRLDEHVTVVCFDGFAALSERFTKQQAWY
jgi:tRNA 2-thiouridine synthesizing protein B